MTGESGDVGVVVYPARVVRTMDPARPIAEAVAVRGSRVRAVGSLEELTAYYGSTRVDDRYRDAVIFPGFVEAHTHMGSSAMWKFLYVGYSERTDPQGRTWPGCTDIGAVIDRLRQAEATLDNPNTPLCAWGLDPILLAGDRLDRRHLDQVSATRPIGISHQNRHVMTVNTAALRADGITRDTSVEGIVRDGMGEPTGELREQPAMSLVHSAALDFTSGSLAAKADVIRMFGADACRHGTTTLTDLFNVKIMQDDYPGWLHSVVDDEDFPARIAVFYGERGGREPGEVSGAVARLRELRRANSDKLRFGYVKFVLDGSNQAFTGRQLEPGYLPDDRKGIWMLPPEELPDLFQAHHDGGMLVHAHCNGDEATQVYLNTIEHALEVHPRWDHRHTVTHSQLSTPAQYRRMAALGVCANIFSNHIWYWGDQHHDIIFGPDRASRMNAAASALRAGVPITLHCDTPVTPLDPLATASYAVTRKTQSGRVLGELERITVEQALHAMTLGAAYTLKMDDQVGSIEAGKYADFAILDTDPLMVDGDALRDIRVLGSVSGGRHFPSDNG